MNGFNTMISKQKGEKRLCIRPPKPIIVETLFLLLSSFLFSLSPPFTLGGQEFSKYAIGLACVAITSIGSLGIPSIIPAIVLNDRKPEGQILECLKYQCLTSSIIYAAYFLFFKSALAINMQASVFTTRIFMASSLYFVGQTIDEVIHTYLRNTGRQEASLKANVASKTLIVGYVLIAPLWIRNGLVLFEAVAFLIVITAFAKVVFYILVPHPWAITSQQILPRYVFKNIFSMWIGNTSNAIYSGIMRILFTSALGISTLGILALSSQIATSFSMIASSLSFNTVFNPSTEDKKNRATALINANNISKVLAVIAATTTIVAVGYIYFIKDQNFITVNEVLLVLVPVSIGFASNVGSVTCYQICQISGAFRKINYINLVLSLIGLGTSYLMINALGMSYMLYYVYMITGFLSAFSLRKLSEIDRLTS